MVIREGCDPYRECPEVGIWEWYHMAPRPATVRGAFCRKYGWKEEHIVEMVVEALVTRYSVVATHLVRRVP